MAATTNKTASTIAPYTPKGTNTDAGITGLDKGAGGGRFLQRGKGC